MLKEFRITLFGVLILLSGLIYSCSKRQDPASELQVKVSQNAKSDLVNSMVSNQLVKEFAHDCDKITGDYEAALARMSNEERKALYAHNKLAAQRNSAPDYLVRTQQQMEEFNALQASRVRQIDAAFPEYAQMEEGQKAEVMAKVLSIIGEGSTTSNIQGGGCFAGYKACMSGCGGGTCANACWAGLQACLAIMYPAP